eukprot:m.133314 g.133314  ORF g.133314 m.133314 type:complete len:107 (+) comp14670_c0_seq5:143-463(+)
MMLVNLSRGVWRSVIQRPNVRTRMRGLHPRLKPTFLVLSDGATVNTWTTDFMAPPVKLSDDIRSIEPWSQTGQVVDISGRAALLQRRQEEASKFVLPEMDDDDDDW